MIDVISDLDLTFLPGSFSMNLAALDSQVFLLPASCLKVT